MKRPLHSTEQMFVLTGKISPFAAVGVLCLENAPDPDLLRAALDNLQARQPLLRVKVSQHRRRPYFESPAQVPPIPLRLVARQDDRHWRRLATEALNTAIDLQTAPLFRCTYLCQAGQAGPAELIFTFHHAVTDAASIIPLYHELLSYCAAETQAKRPSTLPLLPAAEQLFPPKMRGLNQYGRLFTYLLRQITDEMSFRRRLGAGRRPPIQPTADCRILTRKLDQNATRALVRRSRRQRVTMYSVISTAMLLAVKKMLYHDETRPFRAMTFANLRPYLQPVVPNDYLGCYVAMLRHTIYLPGQADFWSSVHAFQEVRTRSARRGEHFAAAITSKPAIQLMSRFQPFRLACTAVSYVGPVKLQPAYGSIQLTGLHGFISNNRLGPEYTAFATILDGQLTWDFLYLDSDMDQPLAEAIGDEINQLLRRAC